MNKKTTIFLLIITILTLSLAACQRPASQAPAAISQPTSSELDFLVSTEPAKAMVDEAIKATETALAIQEINPEEQAGGGAPAEAATDTQTPNQSAAAIATPVLTRPTTYTLQKGEWPICIARRYDLDINLLFQANGLTMASRPVAGAVLNIPQSGSWSSAFGARTLRAHPTDYTVQSGDSIYTIACHFGDVSPEAIIAVNQLSGAGDISTGKVLRIP